MGKAKKTEADDAKGIRSRLIKVLADYNRLEASMAEMENMFLTHVLMPSYQLRDTVRRREFLEGEYNRIKGRIRDNYYSTSAEVEEDVRSVMKRSEVEFSQKSLDDVEELLPKGPTAGLEVVDRDFAPDDREKDRIIREFKRTVIPRVHADTSDASFEEFQTVYSAYKKKDYLLMKAFIIQYQGEVAHKPGESAESFAKRAEKLARESGEVLERLERRMADLKQNMTTLELEEQEKVILQIRNQNKEILRSIYEEAEKILRFQKMLGDFIKTPYIVH